MSFKHVDYMLAFGRRRSKNDPLPRPPWRTTTEFAVLLIVTAHIRDELGYAWPSGDTIAHLSRISRRHVLRTIDKLEERELIRRVAAKRPGGPMRYATGPKWDGAWLRAIGEIDQAKKQAALSLGCDRSPMHPVTSETEAVTSERGGSDLGVTSPCDLDVTRNSTDVGREKWDFENVGKSAHPPESNTTPPPQSTDEGDVDEAWRRKLATDRARYADSKRRAS